ARRGGQATRCDQPARPTRIKTALRLGGRRERTSAWGWRPTRIKKAPAAERAPRADQRVGVGPHADQKSACGRASSASGPARGGGAPRGSKKGKLFSTRQLQSSRGGFSMIRRLNGRHAWMLVCAGVLAIGLAAPAAAQSTG